MRTGERARASGETGGEVVWTNASRKICHDLSLNPIRMFFGVFG